MELRTGATAWGQRRLTELGDGPLAGDERCDALVVGSGISGALAAFHLVRDGADVVVLDKRPLASGSTVVSTALVQYELDVPLVELIPRVGLADAQAIYRSTRGALDDLRALVEGDGLDCDLRQRQSLFLAREAADVDHLRHEALARSQIGIEAVYVDARALAAEHAIRRPGAVRSAVSYELDPRKLTVALLAAAREGGARIYDQTALDERDAPGDQTFATTAGATIRARHVVYATGYETPDRFARLRGACRLGSTYALATEPLPPERLWPGRALLWELASPYFYARTTADDRIIVGGEDDDAATELERVARLPAKAQRLLAELAVTTGIDGVAVDRAWAATFATTDDGLPLIGTPAGLPNRHFSLGFGGNGILFGLLGAQIVRDAIAGRHHPAARLFDFRRVERM